MNLFHKNGLKKNCHEIKMNNNTVKQLKDISKVRGIKGYYKLRKSELINALEATRLVEQKSSIFDEPIPNDPTPVLQSTPWRPSNIALKYIQNINNFASKTCKREKNSLLWVCKRLKILASG